MGSGKITRVLKFTCDDIFMDISSPDSEFAPIRAIIGDTVQIGFNLNKDGTQQIVPWNLYLNPDLSPKPSSNPEIYTGTIKDLVAYRTKKEMLEGVFSAFDGDLRVNYDY